MRLINASTLESEEFFGDSVPPYAILSHTWEEGEVTLKEWASRDTPPVSEKAGLAKIKGACRQALKDSIGYIWVDTNCIDKTSSSELSEAINSMFAWYKDSLRCYVYLVDVSAPPDTQDTELGPSVFEQSEALRTAFSSSRWFTRGWTLQELIASPQVTFFTNCWQPLGDKTDPPLLDAVHAVTGIREEYIANTKNIALASVSEKFSWMANRVTTRSEDIAYCMLGLFDISMPLLYGEGRKAFERLQEHIIAVSNDHTIFCWNYYPDDTFPKGWDNILAPHPSAFRDSAKFDRKPAGQSDQAKLSEVYSITNAGLSISLPTWGSASSDRLVLLNVDWDGWDVAIVLEADGCRNGSFRGPIAFPSSLSKPFELINHSMFLKCRGHGRNLGVRHDRIPLVLIGKLPIDLDLASGDYLYYRSHSTDEAVGSAHMAVLDIPSAELEEMGSLVYAIFSTFGGYRSFIVAVARTLSGLEWYCQTLDPFKARRETRQSLGLVMPRLLQKDSGITRSTDSYSSRQCALIVPLPQPIVSAGSIVFTDADYERRIAGVKSKGACLGAYCNQGLFGEPGKETHFTEHEEKKQTPEKEKQKAETFKESKCCVII